MAATLAATHPSLFAAVGIHSGLPHGIAHDMPSAFGAMRGQGGTPRKATGAVRMIVFHGAADATVHTSNAEALVAAAGPALRGTSRREQGRSEGGRAYSRNVVEAGDGTPLVESWRIEGTGHAWSGGRAGGTGGCLPEDVGGVPGYEEFLEALANPITNSTRTWSAGRVVPSIPKMPRSKDR